MCQQHVHCFFVSASLKPTFGRRIAKHSKTEQLNKLNQRGKLVKYPTTLLHLSKTQKTQTQATLMLWEGNRQLQEYTDDFVFTTIYDDQSFEPVSRVVQSRDKDCDDLKIYHYHNNHLGTPQELTNEQGEMVWLNYEFAWGGTYQNYYKGQSINGIVIDKDELQPLKFQGQYYDPETSLHYNRFRYYDSDVGMFIQRDPIGLLGGVNIFAYAPNPVHWIDPWGLAKKPCTDQDVHNTIQEKLQKGGKGLNLDHPHFGKDRVMEILKNPDQIYVSQSSKRNLIYHQGGDIVVVGGANAGSKKGIVITGYGSSGIKGESGAKVLGGLPTDQGPAITREMIIKGEIPGNIAPAVPINFE